MTIIDLFCKAGGASMGLHRAFPGARIIGVDIEYQPRYPFEFVQANALEYPLQGASLVWASPPCLKWTSMGSQNISHQDTLPDLIDPIRKKLIEWGGAYVIENVPRAPLKNYVVLCGTMFGLKVYRHRLFECNPQVSFPPFTCNHTWRPMDAGLRHKRKQYPTHRQDWVVVVGKDYDLATASRAMGIEWMRKKELSQAIPPAYSEWIGRQIAGQI